MDEGQPQPVQQLTEVFIESDQVKLELRRGPMSQAAHLRSSKEKVISGT